MTIDEMVSILLNGGIGIVPTDTSYGIIADATNESALRKVFSLKNRPYSQVMYIMVRNTDMAKEYAIVPKYVEQLWQRLESTSLTLILPLNPKANLSNLLHKDNKIGVRLAVTDLLYHIIKKLNRPIIATSANPYKYSPPYSIKELKEQWKHRLKNFDFIIDGGKLPKNPPSTVFDPIKMEILREGNVSLDELLEKYEVRF